jgi:sulfite reductase (ferredoxin)
VKLHVTGCPNACGQHWIADVGLQGVRVKQGPDEVDGFDVFVGGGLGVQSGVAHRVGFRAAADEIPDALEGLFGAYQDGRGGGETFRAWSARVGDAAVKAALASGLAGGAVATGAVASGAVAGGAS